MKKLREKSFGGKIHGIWNYLQQHDEVILQKIPIILLSCMHMGFPLPHVWTHPLKRELCFNRSQPICLDVFQKVISGLYLAEQNTMYNYFKKRPALENL